MDAPHTRGAESGGQTIGAAVVVSHNSAAYLAGCVQALRCATAVGQIVVVDNASVDRSMAVVREVADDRVVGVEAGRNTGFAGGCNRGWAAVTPGVGWVAFVNPDVVVEPDCLARCAEVLDASPEVAGVAPRLMRPDGMTVDSVGQVLRRRTLEVQDRGYGRPLDGELMAPRQVLAPCGALAVYRSRALEGAAAGHGPWAEHFFCFWEDLELGWRLSSSGWRNVAAPDAVAVHQRGAGAAPGRGPLRWRRPPELEACVITNRWMTLIRHLHPLDLARRLPLLLAWDVALVAAGIVRRPSLAVHLRRRWSLVWNEWKQRSGRVRPRLAELPW